MSNNIEASAAEMVPIPTDRGHARRAVVSGALGSALEWMDFVLFAVLSATVFPQVFFADLGETGAVLASFLTFGVGFAARPLGSVICGYLGDRVGRKNVLFATLMIMGMASIGIALLPPVSSIGVIAPIALVTLRFLQGFALGGEATGSQLLTMEHSPANRRALFSALTLAGSPISQVFANISLLVLSLALTEEDYFAWGWRVPFVVAIALLIVGVYVRLKVTETPIYAEEVSESEATPGAWYVLRHHGKTIVRLALTHAAAAVTFNFITVYGLSYLSKQIGFPNSETLSILMIANSVGIPAVIYGGWLADRIGRRLVYVIGTVICLLSAVTFFPLAEQRSYWLAVTISAIAVAGVQLANGAQAALFGEAFPTRIRFQGSALSLTLSTLVFGAMMPFISASILALSNDNPIGIVVFWTTVCVVSLTVAIAVPEGKSLEGLPQQFRGRKVLVGDVEIGG